MQTSETMLNGHIEMIAMDIRVVKKPWMSPTLKVDAVPGVTELTFLGVAADNAIYS